MTSDHWHEMALCSLSEDRLMSETKKLLAQRRQLQSEIRRKENSSVQATVGLSSCSSGVGANGLN